MNKSLPDKEVRKAIFTAFDGTVVSTKTINVFDLAIIRPIGFDIHYQGERDWPIYVQIFPNAAGGSTTNFANRPLITISKTSVKRTWTIFFGFLSCID